jgi:enamine deaminase RidA (YjgF/YER057c/UK114 family)
MSEEAQQEGQSSQFGRLIKVYIKMRERLKELEAQKEDLDEQMKKVKANLLDACNEIGANSLNTPFGRLTRTLKTRYWTTDWESMHRFIKDNDAADLLERRIHQTNMKSFLEEHPDLVPPGLNAEREYDLRIYRK